MGKNYTDAVLRNDEVLLHDGNGREVGGGGAEKRDEENWWKRKLKDSETEQRLVSEGIVEIN